MIARVEPSRAVGMHAPRLVAALDQILLWIERSKQRSELADLEPHALHDLGLSRADCDTECRKHFWQC
jgi:uncharacterized protein YjiS (DUF1127 family)